jgi:hypothetical protein
LVIALDVPTSRPLRAGGLLQPHRPWLSRRAAGPKRQEAFPDSIVKRAPLDPPVR